MHNNNQWTDARFSSFVKGALRAASSRWPPKYAAINNAYTGKKINSKSGREAKHFKCNCCWGEFPASEIQVDHIQPVIDPYVGFISWDEVVKRMFCEVEGFQILCKTCHQAKTNAEKRQAKERRKNNE